MLSLSSDRRAVSVPGRALINGSHTWGFLFSNSFCIDDNFPVYHVEMMNYTVVETLLEWCSEKSRLSQVIFYIKFWKARQKNWGNNLFKCVAFKIKDKIPWLVIWVEVVVVIVLLCWRPDPQYLKMWPCLEIRLLQI